MSESDVEFIGEWKKPEQGDTTDYIFMGKTMEFTDAQRLRNFRMNKKRVPPRSIEKFTSAVVPARVPVVELEKDPLAPDSDPCDIFRLETHRNEPSERAYVCDTCGKRFARRRSMVNHFRRPYRCSASEFYASEGYLSEHRKEFVCVYCHRIFEVRAYMNRHVRNLHEGQVSSCDICNKTFSCAAYVRKHVVRVHKSV